MGRMFSTGNTPRDRQGNDALSRISHLASHSAVRSSLLVLEVACAIIGYLLITFRWGANAQFCQPEVYWTTTALVVTVSIVVVFSGLAFISSIIIRAFSISPWMQDFAESFWEADLLAKVARNEAKEDKISAAAQAKAAEADYEAQFKEWLQYHEEFDEERQRHEEIMKEHAEYQEAIKEAPPQWMAQDALDEPATEVGTVPPLNLPNGSERNDIGNLDDVTLDSTWGMAPQQVEGAYAMPPPWGPPPGSQFVQGSPWGPPTGMAPQFVQGPATLPPGSFASMPYAALPPGPPRGLPGAPYGALPPGPPRGRPGMPVNPFQGQPGTLPPGSFGPPFGPPGTLPPGSFQGAPGTFGTLPPSSFRGPPQFLDTTRSFSDASMTSSDYSDGV